MPPKNRNNGKHELILDAAVRVFAERGYHQTTISQIARQAGVADGTIYLYFKNKEDILATFVRQRSEHFFECFKQEVDKQKNAVDKLHKLVRLHFREAEVDMHKAFVYQVEMRTNRRLMRGEIMEALKMYLDTVGTILEEGQQEGSVRHDLYIGLAKRMIFASVDEVITTWVRSGGKYDLIPLAEPLVDMILSGLSPR
ncbi:MAG: TetR/AcrR family transcriptional regulator [Desulfatibacillaceae bacterium]